MENIEAQYEFRPVPGKPGLYNMYELDAEEWYDPVTGQPVTKTDLFLGEVTEPKMRSLQSIRRFLREQQPGIAADNAPDSLINWGQFPGFEALRDLK